ncbi:TonB-dependent receptor [Flavivirga sp. 57AJ16]|uniref:SusC/RagA family TonB-linked outer membrane protein n=1 Tax=Flavivirga sp. 57AJ16 TaxID=3025307 RepID=UPI002365EAF9|nr:TonB-dependent receptor [Flavivirga sp. 57AJ16]MDD7886282.1 TonB-dependent receptor [Flavivirga sp. 57AJ16]
MKKFLKKLGNWYIVLPMLMVFMSPYQIIGQNKTNITGVVKSTEGNIPLAGVTILEKGTTNGTATDFDGIYTLSVPANATLVFSYVGFITKEISVNGQSTINIQMAEDLAQLDEIVVVGYGTQRKQNLTSAISVVKSEEIQKRQVTTLAESLQGLATGVNVRGGGRPGQEATIEIRGLKNLQSANPLYVIDGLITTANRDFNPNDIESIQILKDAAAAAIYGSRAANGVIIVTTKKGKKGPLKIEVSSNTSITELPRYDLAQTEEFAALNTMAYVNAGETPPNLQLENNTNWQEEMFRTGFIQNHNVSFSGGGDNSTFFVSANYFGNKGTVIDSEFNRTSFRINTSGKRGIFSVGENIALTFAEVDEYSGNPILDVVRMLPTIPVLNPNNPGGYGYGEQGVANTFGTNPVAINNLIDVRNNNFRIRGNFWAEINPISSLKYRLNVGYETSFDNRTELRKAGSWTLNQPIALPYYNENRARSQSKLIENTLSFDKEFGKHEVKLLVGQTYQSGDYAQINGSKTNISINSSTGEYFEVLDQAGDGVVGGFKNATTLISYLGRLEYQYDNRYLLNAVFRRDGSSRFDDLNKWGNFPSLSLGWRLSNESFFNVEAISDLKIRASYGELGSGNIGPYDYQGVINTFGGAVFGTNQTTYPSATQVSLANSTLRWERLIQKNIGVDLSLFDNAVNITAEYFVAKTEDVLFGTPILLSTGNDGGNPISNAATVENKGFELSLGYNKSWNEFKFNGSINVTTLSNELISLGTGLNEFFSGNTITTVGEPVGMWYVLQTDGLFQSDAEVQNYTSSDGTVIMPGAQPGDIRFKDINDDGQINNVDKEVVGSPWPDFTLGLNSSASYKGFEFSMNWIGSFGATVFNSYRSVVDRFDDDTNYRSGVQPWTPENPNTNFPRIVKSTTLNTRGDTDRWLENGDFIRLKYIGLGYNLNSNAVEKFGIDSVRFTLSAQNIITITDYQGLDPEFSGPNIFERGVDGFAFPNLKTYSFGVEFNF